MRLNWKEYWQREGGGRELLKLALPLILSNSFLTLQVAVDRILLSHYSIEAMAASIPAVALYFTPFILLQCTANYASTFVAQYVGAKRPQRVGHAVWQSLYFSLFSGIAFLGFYFIAWPAVRLGENPPRVQELEVVYFRILCFAALPALVVASVNSFFSGRGDSWTILLIDSIGLAVNTVLAFLLIQGRYGFPEWGIEGAGWATVIGSACSAITALLLFFRKRYRDEFQTTVGWRFDPELFRRLMRFGIPNGLQWMLDVLAFTVFVFLVGRLGEAEQAASNIAFTINMVAVLPTLGLGNAVCILVGQRLGQNREELAERTTWTGFSMAWVYMGVVAVLYFSVPELFLYFFENREDPKGGEVARLIPFLLRFVAVYSLFDSMSLIFSFALRGAGDTRFVTKVAFWLSWPLMVIPTWAAWKFGWGLYAAWGFASSYVIALGLACFFRFRTGVWKSMRVIEQAPLQDSPSMELEVSTLKPTEIREWTSHETEEAAVKQ